MWDVVREDTADPYYDLDPGSVRENQNKEK